MRRSLVIGSLLVLCETPIPAFAAQAAVTPPTSFESIQSRAAEARDAGRPDEAIRWYRRGVNVRPQWDEGWWYLGTLFYERDRYPEAIAAFQRFQGLKPQPGPALALLGLCEFQLKRYAAAVRHLGEWHAAGSFGNAETQRVAWYHLAVLRIRGGQFELALEPLTKLCRSVPETPRISKAAGLMILRLATFPDDIPREQEELVGASGRAAYSWLANKVDEARARFKELIHRFPDAPNVHYCYGLFLLGQHSDEALAQFQKEIELHPRNVYPHLETAFELLKVGDPASARPYAEAAVRLAPGLFAAHNALGRVLVELGELPRGIKELEEAARLAPEGPEMFYALALAYDRAGRKDDADRARATFQTLDKARRARKGEGRVP